MKYFTVEEHNFGSKEENARISRLKSHGLIFGKELGNMVPKDLTVHDRIMVPLGLDAGDVLFVDDSSLNVNAVCRGCKCAGMKVAAGITAEECDAIRQWAYRGLPAHDCSLKTGSSLCKRTIWHT